MGNETANMDEDPTLNVEDTPTGKVSEMAVDIITQNNK